MTNLAKKKIILETTHRKSLNLIMYSYNTPTLYLQRTTFGNEFTIIKNVLKLTRTSGALDTLQRVYLILSP